MQLLNLKSWSFKSSSSSRARKKWARSTSRPNQTVLMIYSLRFWSFLAMNNSIVGSHFGIEPNLPCMSRRDTSASSFLDKTGWRPSVWPPYSWRGVPAACRDSSSARPASKRCRCSRRDSGSEKITSRGLRLERKRSWATLWSTSLILNKAK